MKIKDAIAERFRQICSQRKISYTELARLSGVTPSTVYSMLEPKRRDVSAITVKKLCDGLDLFIADFYDCELFRTLPPRMVENKQAFIRPPSVVFPYLRGVRQEFQELRKR